MCGIAGFNFEDKELVKRMCDVISHRGPDDEGYYINKCVSLGHRRLSIIDIETGKQPIYNEDGSVVIVYNGEVYNFKELRKELEDKGHKFYTTSDTEVLVHAYEEYGDFFVKKLNGMFAFAIWDDNKKKLLLGRDITGIKPLHYILLNDSTFIFGSEIKSIIQYEKVKREVDLQSLHHFINLRYVPKERTMFKNIKRLLPGHIMIVKDKQVDIKKYWELKIEPEYRSEEYYVEKLRKILKESVERHMVSDVPVGALLSGGIDSSAIVAFASQLNEKPLKTFCMGFGNPDDETDDARIVADYFGTDHHELIVESHILRDFPKMIWYVDEPKRNLYPYYISELVSKYVKTAQSGLGGDEILGGYIFKYNFVSKIEEIRKKTTYQTRQELLDAADKLISFQTRYGSMVDDGNLDYLEMMKYIDNNTKLYLITQTLDRVWGKEYLEKMYGENMLKEKLDDIAEVYTPYFQNNLSFIEQVMFADFSVKMADDFLLVDDRMSMAHSFESRVPFLDKEMIEFSFNIPVDLKIKDINGKYLLRKAMKGILPDSVLKKEKHGFASGTYSTYLRELKEYAMQKLPEGNLVKKGYFKKNYIEKVLNEIPNPKLTPHYDVIWNLLAFEIWYEIYIDADNIYKPKLNKI